MYVRISPTSKVTLYPGEPKLFVNDLDGPVLRDLLRRMTRVKFESRKLVRVRTGHLLSTIETRVGGTKGRGVHVDVVAGGKGIKYTGYEHDGTPPHVIRARRKKALRFMINGNVVFRTKVNHPGTTGTLFLTHALPYAAI
jgi:hypothetical protein